MNSITDFKNLLEGGGGLLAGWLASLDQSIALTSNAGSVELPFQRWMKFKEAFSPAFVLEVLQGLPYEPTRCLDPFGGSGTTSLTCNMLGMEARTIEVNPFLADLIESKLTPLDPTEVALSIEAVIEYANDIVIDVEKELLGAPKTLCEPGVKGRFIYWRDACERILTIREAISHLTNLNVARLLRVLLGGILVETSNVVVNGKGRKYRKGWQERYVGPADVDRLWFSAVQNAVADLARYQERRSGLFELVRGDARQNIRRFKDVDIAIFSPPYPNSFDYTDVYNLELWMLGYFRSTIDNAAHRKQTLRSHVQTKFDWSAGECQSPILDSVVAALTERQEQLWNKAIPSMVSSYFDDMLQIFEETRKVMVPDSHIVAVIGDSQYAGVHIKTDDILEEILSERGFEVLEKRPVRAMRNSAQHGGVAMLDETALTVRFLGD